MKNSEVFYKNNIQNLQNEIYDLSQLNESNIENSENHIQELSKKNSELSKFINNKNNIIISMQKDILERDNIIEKLKEEIENNKNTINQLNKNYDDNYSKYLSQIKSLKENNNINLNEKDYYKKNFEHKTKEMENLRENAIKHLEEIENGFIKEKENFEIILEQLKIENEKMKFENCSLIKEIDYLKNGKNEFEKNIISIEENNKNLLQDKAIKDSSLNTSVNESFNSFSFGDINIQKV